MPNFDLTQLRLNAYRVLVANPHSGIAQDLTTICSSIQWDYDLDQACEKFTITFVKVEDLARQVKPLDHVYVMGVKVSAALGIGTEIEPLKFGIIIEGGIKYSANGELQITAYDIMWYLTANKASHMLQAETATSFFTRICGRYGVPIGHVEDTRIIIGPAPFLEQTLYEMFVTTLAITRDVAFTKRIQDSGGDPTKFPLETRGPRFFLRTNVGKVSIIMKRDPTHIWKLETANIYDAESTWSAATYRNAVKVYNRSATDVTSDGMLAQLQLSSDGDISIVGEIPAQKDLNNDPDIRNYGLLSETVSLVGATDPALRFLDSFQQADYQAKELYVRLKRFQHGGTFTSPNINTIGPGDAILLNEPITGLVGKFYVKSGMHKVTAKNSTMSLTVTLEDLLPEAYKTKPESTSSLIGGPIF